MFPSDSHLEAPSECFLVFAIHLFRNLMVHLGYMKFWTTISIWQWEMHRLNFNQINVQFIFVGT
jgi:hypothetical protein